MSLKITPNAAQALDLKTQLTLLQLPANKRTRILKTLGRYERAQARARIKRQQALEGGSFTPRANGKKGKMLKRLGRTLEPYVKNADRLELKHKNALTGRIAALQQEGGEETMTASKMRRIHGQPDYDAPASRAQAKALSAEGYKVRKKKGGWRRASIREIQDTLTVGKAGVILRSMRDSKSQQRWNIPVPARPFLGDYTTNVQRELMQIIQQVQKRG
ncbi:hypothetical protein [Shewanella sp.]|uniref:hypothetical protein n=1 Tax=Shewanella sp. TaxID=50422 RepID=UPI003A97BDD9